MMRRQRRFRASRLGVMATLAVCGLLLATSARVSGGNDLRQADGDLAQLAAAQTRSAARKNSRIIDLQHQVDRLTAAEGVADGRVRAATNRAEARGRAAGLDAVHGPSLTVTLDDAPRGRPQPSGVTSDDVVIHQQDVQAVVNALWAGGAEAVAIQGKRLVSTSAVRCVGNTLRLQGRVYSPPYVISAVGDRAAMRSALGASKQLTIYRQYVDWVGLGWNVTSKDSDPVDGYEGPTELKYATVPHR
ncbi:DUF881 domain-containing protein [Spelaeicoccus albus]|uniref:DUF881 domain-containing protein n=1 Tax=Spelaeicoccus albus TaxID=1280376 RepID=UPI001F39317B|nr:DUF881 domain-containing protein [Spelaeicoccus albus]